MTLTNLKQLLTVFLIGLTTFLAEGQDVKNNLIEHPLYPNDSIKIMRIRNNNIDENAMIYKIEEILNNMEYDVISSDLPIRTDKYEASRVRDTIKFLFIRLDVIDYPIMVRHNISFEKLENDKLAVWLKSYVLVEEDGTDENINQAIEIGKKYTRKEFKKSLRDELRKIIDE